MQITAELIDNNIKEAEKVLEQVKAQAAQMAGVLAVLRNMKEYLAKVDEPDVAEQVEQKNG